VQGHIQEVFFAVMTDPFILQVLSITKISNAVNAGL